MPAHIDHKSCLLTHSLAARPAVVLSLAGGGGNGKIGTPATAATKSAPPTVASGYAFFQLTSSFAFALVANRAQFASCFARTDRRSRPRPRPAPHSGRRLLGEAARMLIRSISSEKFCLELLRVCVGGGRLRLLLLLPVHSLAIS